MNWHEEGSPHRRQLKTMRARTPGGYVARPASRRRRRHNHQPLWRADCASGPPTNRPAMTQAVVAAAPVASNRPLQ